MPGVALERKNKEASGIPPPGQITATPTHPRPTPAPSSSGQRRPSAFPEASGAAVRRHLGCRAPGWEAARARGPSRLRRARCVPEAGGRGLSAAAMTQAEKGDAENGKEKGGEKEKEQRGVKRPIVPALVPESLQEVRRGAGGGSRRRPSAWAGVKRQAARQGFRPPPSWLARVVVVSPVGRGMGPGHLPAFQAAVECQ